MERTGKYYESGRERAKKVEELFSRIAPRYDLINDLQSFGLHRLWKRRLVRLAEVPPGGRALDLCCGTGDIVRALARAYPRSELIAGLDFAHPMLEVALKRGRAGGPQPPAGGCGPKGPAPPDLRRPSSEAAVEVRTGHGANAVTEAGVAGGGGVGRAEGAEAAARETESGSGREPARSQAPARPAEARTVYVRADALRIPARDGSFDRVTISYGLRNVADLAGCLAEVRRVLRPGGRFLVLDFGKPVNPLVARGYFAYLRIGVPIFGRLFFGDPDTHGYILDSLLRFPSQAETAALLREAGFSKVRVETPLLGVMGIHVADV